MIHCKHFRTGEANRQTHMAPPILVVLVTHANIRILTEHFASEELIQPCSNASGPILRLQNSEKIGRDKRRDFHPSACNSWNWRKPFPFIQPQPAAPPPPSVYSCLHSLIIVFPVFTYSLSLSSSTIQGSAMTNKKMDDCFSLLRCNNSRSEMESSSVSNSFRS